MMKKIFPVVFGLIVTFSATAQDLVVNDPNAVVRTVGAFTGIEVSTGIDLTLKQGNTEAVSVSATTPEYRDRIITEVVNGVLKIYFKPEKPWKWNTSKVKPRAYVSARSLQKLNANSGASITIDGELSGDKLSGEFTSGSNVNGAIKYNSLTINQNSGASVRLKGSAATLDVSCTSGADFKSYDLAAETCTADVNSGGNIEVTVNKTLSAKATSGGSVKYKGACTLSKNVHNSGGSIRKKDA